MSNMFPKSFVVGLLLVASAQAATTILDFNSDPVVTGLYTEPGGQSAEWRPSGGFSGGASDGYLVVTRAAGGQGGLLVFKDLENGLIVKAFKFECDLRIGGGTPRPADGFSINYASADDPATTAGGQFNGTDNEPAPSGLAEEGTQTGLAIGFDVWQSDPIKGVQDVVGLSVRVDGDLIAQFPVPLAQGNSFLPGMPNPGQQGTLYTYSEAPYRNLPTNDVNYPFSLQTGARNTTDDLNGDGVVDSGDFGAGGDTDTPAEPDSSDPTYALWFKNLAWEHFTAEVTEEGKVIITWKGREITPVGGLQTAFAPQPGRIILAARTGGAWEVHHVDNIKLVTVPADKLIVGKATGSPVGFTINVTDSGPAIADPATLILKLNGTTVTPTSITKAGVVTTIRYGNPAAPLAIGSTNTVDVDIKDTRPIQVTGTKQFVVPAYYTLPATYAVASANTPGFKLKVHQLGLIQGLPNTVARAERQLHGDIGANVASVTPGPDGYMTQDGVINFNGVAPTAAGNFTTVNGFEDQPIPGVDSTTPGSGIDPQVNTAMEILTYIEFPQAGAYQLIFNSDDGFRTLVGNKGVDVVGSPIFSQVDAGRGAVDTAQNVYVPTAGIYPFRSVWFNGGGGASLEWVGVNLVTGVKALLNDSTTAGALKTYRVATGTFPAAVTYAYPDRSSGNPYFPTDPVTIEITDGTAQVNSGSIQLSINDAPVTVTPTKVGAVTKLQYNPPSPGWPSGSNNKITLVWSDNAAPPVVWSNSWNFTVTSWMTIPPTAAIAASGVDTSKVGFKIKTHKSDQANDLANSSARAIAQLAGTYGPNKLDTSTFGADGYYVEIGVINYEQGALATATTPYDAASVQPARSGDFTDQIPSDRPVADLLFPGEPITDATYATLVSSNKWSDNIAMQALAVLDLQPGFYWSGVNSDDGFRVSFAANPLDVAALIPNVFEGGKGASDVNGLFQITQAGLYPVQLIWYEGGGGASVEWYIQNTLTYQRTLVNDTATPGYVKAYQYPVSAPPAGYVKSVTPTNPASGVRQGVGVGKKVQAVIVDGTTPVDQNSITLKLNGIAVSPITKNKVGTETTVTYNQPLAASSQITAEVSWTDAAPRSSSWTFTTGILPGSTFVIEAEDFNTGGGQTVAGASTMPYLGNAYSNLNALALIDFDRPTQSDSPLYRFGETNTFTGTAVNVPMDPGPGDFDRGGWDVAVNYKIGWTGAGQWYDYTRTFPPGNYTVYAALSHGDAVASASRVRATLQQVTAGVTTTNQTVVQLGTFEGPATGGWGLNRLVPLMNGAVPASVSLSGVQTIRFTTDSGDYDFFAFVPGGAAAPRFDPPTLSGATVTIAWTGAGVLQEASNLTGHASDWTDVVNPTNPFPVTPGASTQKFYRLRP